MYQIFTGCLGSLLLVEEAEGEAGGKLLRSTIASVTTVGLGGSLGTRSA
jgi:hypothetical protein